MPWSCLPRWLQPWRPDVATDWEHMMAVAMNNSVFHDESDWAMELSAVLISMVFRHLGKCGFETIKLLISPALAAKNRSWLEQVKENFKFRIQRQWAVPTWGTWAYDVQGSQRNMSLGASDSPHTHTHTCSFRVHAVVSSSLGFRSQWIVVKSTPSYWKPTRTGHVCCTPLCVLCL